MSRGQWRRAGQSKLKVVKELIKILCEAKCMDVESKGIRRMLTKLRGEL